jgi:hypothetical protein
MSQYFAIDYYLTMGSIAYSWEVVKMDIAGQDRKSGGEVIKTGLGLIQAK